LSHSTADGTTFAVGGSRFSNTGIITPVKVIKYWRANFGCKYDGDVLIVSADASLRSFASGVIFSGWALGCRSSNILEFRLYINDI
jgi:hypothetical protein